MKEQRLQVVAVAADPEVLQAGHRDAEALLADALARRRWGDVVDGRIDRQRIAALRGDFRVLLLDVRVAAAAAVLAEPRVALVVDNRRIAVLINGDVVV